MTVTTNLITAPIQPTNGRNATVKSYTDLDQVIGNAKQLVEQLGALDEALYTMDGEIPHDGADRAVKNTRHDLNEAMKHLGWLASGMWRADQASKAPSTLPDLTAGTTAVRIHLLSCGHVVWVAHPVYGGINHCLSCNRGAAVEYYMDEQVIDAAPLATCEGCGKPVTGKSSGGFCGDCVSAAAEVF